MKRLEIEVKNELQIEIDQIIDQIAESCQCAEYDFPNSDPKAIRKHIIDSVVRAITNKKFLS